MLGVKQLCSAISIRNGIKLSRSLVRVALRCSSRNSLASLVRFKCIITRWCTVKRVKGLLFASYGECTCTVALFY